MTLSPCPGPQGKNVGVEWAEEEGGTVFVEFATVGHNTRLLNGCWKSVSLLPLCHCTNRDAQLMPSADLKCAMVHFSVSVHVFVRLWSARSEIRSPWASYEGTRSWTLSLSLVVPRQASPAPVPALWIELLRLSSKSVHAPPSHPFIHPFCPAALVCAKSRT